MAFHVRLSFKDIEKPTSKSVILLADTILVMKDEDNQILTAQVPRKYEHISYTLDEEEEAEKSSDEYRFDKSQSKTKDSSKHENGNGQVLTSRTRGA